MYKQSIYTIFVADYAEGSLVANLKTGALAVMDGSTKEFLSGISSNPHYYDNEWFAELLKQGFIVPVLLDEYNELAYNNVKYKIQDTSHLSLVIAPTLECNLSCFYCYQKNTKLHASLDFDALFSFISANIAGVEELYVTWYGGEPLLHLDAIERFTTQIQALCQEKKVQYNCNLITNGSLLSATSVRVFQSLHIKDIQITLDGMFPMTSLYKGSTQEQFEETISFLCEACAKDMPVSLRMNVDKNNWCSCLELVKLLLVDKALLGKLRVYAAPIDPIVISNCDLERFFIDAEITIMEQEFRSYLLSLGHSAGGLNEYRPSYCGMKQRGSMLVDPSGDLYSCYNHIGNTEKSIGNIYTGIHYTDYFLHILNPDFPAQCQSCNVLPICLGGCPENDPCHSALRCQSIRLRILNDIKSFYERSKQDEDYH